MRLSIDASQCRFAIDVRVRWADTDAVGIAYNGAYLTWFEVARVEFSRALTAWKRGVPLSDPQVQDHLFDQRMTFTLASSTINWLSPCRVDARLRVATRISRVGESSYDHQFVVTRVADGERVCQGESTQVRVDPRTLLTTALGDELKADLSGFARALETGALTIPPYMA